MYNAKLLFGKNGSQSAVLSTKKTTLPGFIKKNYFTRIYKKKLLYQKPLSGILLHNTFE